MQAKVTQYCEQVRILLRETDECESVKPVALGATEQYILIVILEPMISLVVIKNSLIPCLSRKNRKKFEKEQENKECLLGVFKKF